MGFPLIKLAKKLKVTAFNGWAASVELFPLIKLAKKLKEKTNHSLPSVSFLFPLIKLAKKLKVVHYPIFTYRHDFCFH